ncbi:MAG: hypothetical protein GX774_06520 [Armatimonadetes bacterium]|nr:hypothetical protein [Armatimonadota bacterium]
MSRWCAAAAAAALALTGVPPPAAEEPGKTALPKPSPQQYAWQERERIQFVCLDPCTWQGREYDDHSFPLSRINPEKLDTDQWCRAALAWGAKQILFVAKHTGGFCWWQTETSRYGVKETPWRGGKGDLVKELSQSCRRFGLKLGIYVYAGDDTWGAPIGSGGRTQDPAKQEAYNQVYRQQLTEVLTRYGEISEVWFDGGVVIPVGDILEKYAPNAVIFGGPHATIRWVGNEAGYAPYPAWNTVKKADAVSGGATSAHGDPDGDTWLPVEVDTPLYNHFWFWSPEGMKHRKSLDQLLDIYYHSVGHGAVLLLNSTPNTDGLIPEDDMRLYEAFGRELQRRFGRPLAATKGRGTTLELRLGRATPINHVIVMEDYREGERIREYVVEGYAGRRWQPLSQGTAVGRKKIDVFPTATVTRVRLRVTKAAAEPIIREMAVYHVPGMMPERVTPALWRFDAGQGGRVSDTSGKQHGTIHGATWAEGRNGGRALRFSGAEYVALTTADLYDSDFTLAAWVNPRPGSEGRERHVLSKERNGVNPMQLAFYLSPENHLGLRLSDDTTGVWPFESKETVAAGEWSHVAVTRRGRELALYLNGRLVARTESAAVIHHRNRLEWRVGARYAPGSDGADFGFDGLIESVGFWTRALTPEELARPDALPAPGAGAPWTKAGAWAEDALGRRWTTLEFDLSPFIPAARQYEVELRPIAAPAGFEVRAPMLLFEGLEAPAFLTRLPRKAAWNINRTQIPTGKPRSTVLRVQVRATGKGHAAGEVMIRAR